MKPVVPFERMPAVGDKLVLSEEAANYTIRKPWPSRICEVESVDWYPDLDKGDFFVRCVAGDSCPRAYQGFSIKANGTPDWTSGSWPVFYWHETADEILDAAFCRCERPDLKVNWVYHPHNTFQFCRKCRREYKQ